MPPPHMHFEPRTMCAYYTMHTSGRQMTADEVGYLLCMDSEETVRMLTVRIWECESGFPFWNP